MRFLPLFLLFVASKVAFASPLPAFEGTMSQTQNGITTRAQIAWQPPETLVIQTPREDANGIGAQTIIASGNQTLLYQSGTKRTRRYGFNIAKSWWRGSNLESGGPANYLFAGTSFPTNPTEGRFLRRDDVLFGGSGQGAYYAAVKTPTRRFAAQITTTKNTRIEKNEAAKTVLEAQITLNEAGFPTLATVNAAGERASFAYELKPATNPLALPPILTEIIEDEILGAPSSYAANDASSLYNRGAALALNEDFPAALAAFEAAAQAAPTASAPHLASFEIALLMRDPARAAISLSKLEQLQLDAAEIAIRRARIAQLQRDDETALAAWKAATVTAPQNLALRLQEAQMLRNRGDFDGARAIYQIVLASPTATPQNQVLAAQNLALSATPDEWGALLAATPSQTPAQKLARSLLQLRSGQAPETTSFENDFHQIALALGLERAARDDEAKTVWENLEARESEATKNRARAHLVTLAARRGEVSQAITKWRAWNASLKSETERSAARSAFLGAFQKAFRSDALKSALSNRASATGATEDDLRLSLNYQELYGTEEDIAAAIENGVARFPSSAFWAGKKAEILVGQAAQTRGTDAGLARREQLFDQTNQILDRAIQNAPDEPFYRFQKALAATQRGAKTGGVIDATLAARARAVAKRETEKLLADFPGDADVLVSAALQNLAFEGESNARNAVQLANLALDTAPVDGDRHTLVWAARQALATAYRRLKTPDLAAAQWEMLLLGAQNAGDASALAGSYFSLLESTNSAEGSARLLTQVASEKWDYSAARAALETLATRIAASPLAPAIAMSLADKSDGAAILANATLAQKRLEAAQRALEATDAPPIADANLDRATQSFSLALGKLRAVADGNDRVLAARAAAFLAENANLAGEERLALLRRALQIEPRDSALRFALIGALSGEEGKRERENAAKTLDFEPETRRQLTSAARENGEATLALQIGEEALAQAARSPEVSANVWQRLAFSVAKTAFQANQTSRALELYNGLSQPQWNPIDRAAAHLALSRLYQQAGKADEAAKLNVKVAALGLERAEIEGAIVFLDEVEN
ncbi:MAG TPA: hypothetical protein VGB45_05090 [Abditibacterium sp.]